MRPNTPVPTDIACPTCGRKMAVRTGRTGVFLGCTGYDLPKNEKCTKTINLVPGEEAVTVTGPDDEAAEGDADALRAKKRCAICATAMDAYLVDETRKLHICGNNPDCPGTMVEMGTYKLRGYEGPTFPCDKCGKPMELKSGRFGKYFGCTGWPECTNTRKLMRNGEPAPPKIAPVHMTELPCSDGKAHYVLRDGLLGLFLAASSYPKLRETKPPQVADLVRHRAEIDPKYHWLADAPAKDPEGRPTIVRFSRKTKEHYLASEADGKPSGWTSWLVDGRWTPKKASDVEDDAPRKGGRRPAAASRN
jgi:DNA topoisomerase-1